MKVTILLPILLSVFKGTKQAGYEGCGKEIGRRGDIGAAHSTGIKTHTFLNPWSVAIVVPKDNSNVGTKIHCSGSILSRKYVLTSAHCFFGFYSKESMVLIVGASEPTNETALAIDKRRKLSQSKKIKSVVFHPLFNKDTIAAIYDIALIEIQGRFTFKRSVWPICIPDEILPRKHHFGKGYTLVGFGLDINDNNQQCSDLECLKTDQLNVKTTEECGAIYGLIIDAPFHKDHDRVIEALPNNFDDDPLICAQVTGQSAASCEGDSGGILWTPVFNLGEGNTAVQQAVVRGSIRNCDGSAFPTIFNRLDNAEVLPWIKSTVFGIDDSTHTCPEGYPIPSSLKCDGTNQCTDGSDEENCMVEEEPHFCPEGYPIPFQLKCDGVSQCSDRDHSYITSDEAGCSSKISPPMKSGKRKLLCDKLTVTGDDWESVTGTYIISNEKASKSPDKPVYKLEGKNRYIHYTLRNGAGWCIARKEHLSGETEGLVYYYSGLDTIEPWLVETQWRAWNDLNKIIKVECATISKTRKYCKSNPCMKGRCLEATNQYYCLCQPNWEGQTCNKKITVPKVECPKLKVSGSDYKGCNGIYVITAEKASRSPSKPVYKKQDFDRYIYHYPSSYGWRIGYHETLSPGEVEGKYWFKGNNKDDTEPWQTGNEWDDPSHPNEKLRVECLRN